MYARHCARIVWGKFYDVVALSALYDVQNIKKREHGNE